MNDMNDGSNKSAAARALTPPIPINQGQNNNKYMNIKTVIELSSLSLTSSFLYLMTSNHNLRFIINYYFLLLFFSSKLIKLNDFNE